MSVKTSQQTTLIRALSIYLSSIQPVFIDGLTYILIAFFAAWAAAFGSDEAAKWINPMCLFWLRSACGATSASLLALKMFRSTTFAEHQQQKKIETSFMTRPSP